MNISPIKDESNYQIHPEQTPSQESRFKSINTENLKEISLSESINTVVKINRKMIDEYNEKIEEIGKELDFVRSSFDFINEKKLQIKEMLASEKFDKHEDYDKEFRSQLKNFFRELKTYESIQKEKELNLINKRFTYEKTITQLEGEIQSAIGGPAKKTALKFNEFVQVHEGKEKKELPTRTQSLDQSYTERSTSNPKTKEKPKTFVKRNIDEIAKTYKKAKTVNYDNIKKIVEERINRLEFSQNPIQKERYLSELDVQLAKFKETNEARLKKKNEKKIQKENEQRLANEKRAGKAPEKNVYTLNFSDEEASE